MKTEQEPKKQLTKEEIERLKAIKEKSHDKIVRK